MTADDDTEILNSLAFLIGNYIEDAEIQKVGSGEELIAEARKGSYNLIFTDNDMGYKSIKDLEAVKQIRTFDTETQIYIISGDKISKEQINESGATGLFDKQRDFKKISSLLERLAK